MAILWTEDYNAKPQCPTCAAYNPTHVFTTPQLVFFRCERCSDTFPIRNRREGERRKADRRQADRRRD